MPFPTDSFGEYVETFATRVPLEKLVAESAPSSAHPVTGVILGG